MPLSSGTLRVSRSLARPGHWWLHLECCNDLGRYYRSLLLRFTCQYRNMMTPAWGYHITIVRQEHVNPELLAKLEGQEIEFEYETEVQTNGKHFWLPVRSERLLDIREQLGLIREPELPLHLTIAVMPGEEEPPSRSDPMGKPFYSMAEAEVILGSKQIKSLVDNGTLRQFRDAGLVFFKAEDVEAARANLSLAGSLPIPESELEELEEHPAPPPDTMPVEELLEEIYPDDDAEELLDLPQYTPEQHEFEYEALKSDGTQITSSVLAESREQAVSQIRSLGYFPTRVLVKRKRPLVLGQRQEVVISAGTIALVLFFILLIENLILVLRYWLH